VRARGKSIFNRFYPDANLQKKDEHFEQMTFPQKRSWKTATLSWSFLRVQKRNATNHSFSGSSDLWSDAVLKSENR